MVSPATGSSAAHQVDIGVLVVDKLASLTRALDFGCEEELERLQTSSTI